MGVEFDADSFIRKMEKNAIEKDNKMNNVVIQNTAELLSSAQRTSPVDTGFMRRSHGMDLDFDDSLYTGEVFVIAYYGVFVNGGTRYMEAQPWFTTAWNKQKAQFLEDAEGVLSDWS